MAERWHGGPEVTGSSPVTPILKRSRAMVVIVGALHQNVEALVTRVFLRAIDILGGLSKLTEYRTLTWLPSLARAVYVVVLREEYLKTSDEIAQAVGLTKQTVQNILRSDIDLALEKLKRMEELLQEEAKELKVHTAGGIAKLAYKQVKEGHEEPHVFLEYCIQTAQALDIPWAYMLLKRLKGTDFPLNSADDIKERVRDVYIKGRRADEVLSELDYSIRTPAELLHRIKENLKMHGVE